MQKLEVVLFKNSLIDVITIYINKNLLQKCMKVKDFRTAAPIWRIIFLLGLYLSGQGLYE